MESTFASVSPEITEKYEQLTQSLCALGSVAVAFSGGVDSTFLLAAAVRALGPDHVLALTAVSCFFPKRENAEAQSLCRSLGVRQVIVEMDELSIPGIRENPANRCYLCKKALFSRMLTEASALGFSHLAEGSNMDDNGDYRPGLIAIAELSVLSPLRENGLYKEEIRLLSKAMDLPTWQKPSFACLASRFVYGETLTEKKLAMVEAAEEFIKEVGFTQFRVRIHDTLARIEVLPEDLPRLTSVHEEVFAKLKSFGFSYVTLDLKGYRAGSMNEVLPDAVKKVSVPTPAAAEPAVPPKARPSDELLDSIWKLECNIDDASGEILGYAMDRLFEAGARDVHYFPVYMKKNRPAWQLNVICDDAHREALEAVIFAETTTIGIRRQRMERTVLPRRKGSVDTPYGPLESKIVTINGKERIYPEYDSAAAIAKREGIPLSEVYNYVK